MKKRLRKALSEYDRKMERELADELERMLVLGLVEIVGKNQDNEDLYQITERGKQVMLAYQAIDEEELGS